MHSERYYLSKTRAVWEDEENAGADALADADEINCNG